MKTGVFESSTDFNNAQYKRSAWRALLETESTTWTDVLVNEEVARITHRSDLDKLVELFESLPSGLKPSEQIGLDRDRVETVIRAFYASLFSTVSAHLDKLQDPTLRENIRALITQKILSAYSKVFLAINL